MQDKAASEKAMEYLNQQLNQVWDKAVELTPEYEAFSLGYAYAAFGGYRFILAEYGEELADQAYNIEEPDKHPMFAPFYQMVQIYKDSKSKT